MLHVNRDAATGQWSYVPDRVEVYPGTTVLIGHLFAPGEFSITSVDGLFNATGNATSWPEVRAPETPGEYRFYCWVHATPDTLPGEGMAGVMVVAPREAPPASAPPSSDGDLPPDAAARNTPLHGGIVLVGATFLAACLARRR